MTVAVNETWLLTVGDGGLKMKPTLSGGSGGPTVMSRVTVALLLFRSVTLSMTVYVPDNE